MDAQFRWLVVVMLFLPMGLCNVAIAQTVTIGDPGSSSFSATIPVATIWPYSYSQQILLASEIGVSGEINTIRFKHNTSTGSLADHNAWTVYLGYKTGNSFTSTMDWVPLSNLTQVYSGIVSASGGWVTLNLATPFPYSTATGNLVIGVDENSSGSYFVQNVFAQNSSAPNYRALTVSGTSNPNPANPPVANARLESFNTVQLEISPACSVTPVATISSNVNAIEPGIPFTLTAGPTGPTGLTYQFQKNEGNSWVNLGSAGSSNIYSTSILGTTQFRVLVSCGSSTGTSAPITVTTLDAVVIGGSSSETSSKFPIQSCYGYSYTQQLYTAAEIAGGGLIGPTIITSISFYLTTGTSNIANYQNWAVYLGNTTKGTFTSTTDWVAPGEMTAVFSGNITMPAIIPGWVTLNLSSPFTYQGGNLVVAVDENSPGSTCGAYWGTYTSASGNRSMLYRVDNPNPDPSTVPPATEGPGTTIPKFKFNYTPIPAVPPSITAFTPGAGCITSEVTITGTGFLNVTGVKFGSAPASSFVVVSPTTIKAYPTQGGIISVTAASGTGYSSNSFTYGTLPAPASGPTPASPIYIDQSFALTATSPGHNILWYTSGGIPIGSTASGGALNRTESIPGTYTYYAESTHPSGCVSITRTPVTVIVQAPEITSITEGIHCGPGSVTLSAIAAPSATAIHWYSSASGGNVLASGNSFTTPSINSSTTYWAEPYLGAVAGQRVAVEAAVLSSGTWTGSASANWNDGANWCGGIPLASTDVVIPNWPANQPIVLNADFATGHSLTIDGGTLTIDPGATLSLNGNLSITPGSQFIADGSLSLTASGTNTQYLADLPFSVGRLVIDGGSDKILQAQIQVTDELQLVNGKLLLGDHTLGLNSGVNATGGSANAYVVTNGNGRMFREVGSTPVLFPVGNTTYNPATLSNSGVPDHYWVRVRDEVLSNGTAGAPVDHNSFYVVNRSWDIEEYTPGSSNVNLTLEWNSGQYNNSAFDPTGVYMAHYTGGIWTNVGQGAAVGSGPYSFTATGINSFSPFTISSLASPFPLPVVLVDVQAANEGKRNKISWQSASEDRLASYIVEKSSDGKTFTQMAEVAAKGKAAGYITYDNVPNSGLTYYRLKMVDQDGTIAYSKTVSAFMNGRGAFALQATPNPTTGLLTITALGGNSTAKIQITDVAGHVIAEVAMTDGKAEVNLSSVAAGVYFVKYADGNHSQTIKITKQ